MGSGYVHMPTDEPRNVLELLIAKHTPCYFGSPSKTMKVKCACGESVLSWHGHVAEVLSTSGYKQTHKGQPGIVDDIAAALLNFGTKVDMVVAEGDWNAAGYETKEAFRSLARVALAALMSHPDIQEYLKDNLDTLD